MLARRINSVDLRGHRGQPLVDDVGQLLHHPRPDFVHLREALHVLHQRVLLALIQAGISREDAYRIVQQNAMQVWHEGGEFEEQLWADDVVRGRMSRADLAACFDPTPYLVHVDTVFDRVFGSAKTRKKPRRKQGA